MHQWCDYLHRKSKGNNSMSKVLKLLRRYRINIQKLFVIVYTSIKKLENAT